MPHLIVEYSGNLSDGFNVKALLAEMHHAIAGLHNVALERIKTRAHKLEDFIVGDKGNNASFMHIELKLMPGRTDDMKTELSGILLNTAAKHITRETALTVEVSELHGPSYRP